MLLCANFSALSNGDRHRESYFSSTYYTRTQPLTKRPCEVISEENNQRYPWGLALLLLLVLVCLNTAAIRYLDNTNLGTTNGLWKAPSIAQWESAGSGQIDSGGVAYGLSMGLLCRLIPSDAVEWGGRRGFLTFREVTLWNGVFGAVASILAFSIAWMMSGSRAIAVLILLTHFSSGFILLNSMNSEDIMPGYTAYLGCALGVVRWSRHGGYLPIIAASVCLALAGLLHWTLLVPGAIALAVCCVIAMIREPRTAIQIGAAACAFFVFVGLALALLSAVNNQFSGSILEFLYPAKAGPSGWVGFQLNKLPLVVTGAGNYFNGAQLVHSWARLLTNRSMQTDVALSWTALLVALVSIGYWWLRSRRSRSGGGSETTAFFLTVLFVGELMAAYGHPYDPQFQIQPLGIIFVGFTTLLMLARQALRGRAWFACIFVFSLLMCANLADNWLRLERFRGGDGRSLEQVAELLEQYPAQEFVIVSHAYEGWSTWLYAVTFKGDREAYLDYTVHLATPFADHQGVSASAAVEQSANRINEAFANGKRVAATVLWNQEPGEFSESLHTLTNADTALEYSILLRSEFDVLPGLNPVVIGTLVELVQPTATGAPR